MRLFRYILCNAIFAGCLWFGIIEGISGAANVAIVWIWVVFATSLFLLYDEAIASYRKNGKLLPLWVDQVFDLCVILFLVWNGWIASGIAYLIHTAFIAVAHRKAFDEPAPSNPSDQRAGGGQP